MKHLLILLLLLFTINISFVMSYNQYNKVIL